MASVSSPGRAGRIRVRRGARPALESLEGRALLSGTPPFQVGGDPIVDPADFRITTFASGLNYPHGMTTLSDGSLLVGLSNPVPGALDFFDTTGQLLRLADADDDGVADGGGTVLYDGLPGQITALHQAGPFILATSSQAGSERIAFLRVGATPAAPLTLVGSINFSFPLPWEHTTFASAVRPTPGQEGSYDVFFNIGSQFNGVEIGPDGNVTLNARGNPKYQPTQDTVGASGLVTGTLLGDSIYMVSVQDSGGLPSVSNLTQIAKGLRNASGLAIDPRSGDLYIGENGIDGNEFGNAAWSTDELDRIPARRIGGRVENFGFPYNYTKTNDEPGQPVVIVNPLLGIKPVVSYEPLPDPAMPTEGSQSEGPSGFALAPPMFPAGLNRGVFVGFHGKFNQGGTANEENPVIFTDPRTGKYFNFISNNEPNIGHIDEILSTRDSLFLADLSSTGDIFGGGGPGHGVIYQIKAINHAPQAAPVADRVANAGVPVILKVQATDPDPGQNLTYSLGPGAPEGASIDPSTGIFFWIPTHASPPVTVTVIATDNGSTALSTSRTFTISVKDLARWRPQGHETDEALRQFIGIASLDGSGGLTSSASQDSGPSSSRPRVRR